MKYLFLITAILFISFQRKAGFVNPTGTYILKGLVEKNVITSHHGEIRAKLLQKDKLVLCFYLNKGYPGFESASFIDTLTYHDNQARYIPPGDTTCNIVYLFTGVSANVTLIYSNPQCTCGFAKGVIAPAVFEKYSAEIPIIQDLSVHRD
jgi:hypothetical protein